MAGSPASATIAGPRSSAPLRALLLWFPDWPVIAAAREGGYPPDAPLAVLVSGKVHACSAAARAFGVRRGLRLREAQERCPELIVTAYDPAVDARAFEPVVTTIEGLAPGVEIVRPGLCALRARGPARYFGGEAAVAVRFREHLAKQGVDCRVGIADGPFAAEQAARQAAVEDVGAVIFPAGETAQHLSGLSVDVLQRPELVSLLRRLGIRTLGDFAALSPRQVLHRFGADGARAHRLACGWDDRLLDCRQPPPELNTWLELEPPVDNVEMVAASLREPAERFVTHLADRGLVCTCLRVNVSGENGERSSRVWRHQRWFDAADVVDRVRWQLQAGQVVNGKAHAELSRMSSAVAGVWLLPEEVDRQGAHSDSLWGEQSPDENVHRTLSRVQSMIGHQAVLTAHPTGGRGPADRVGFVPWGDRLEPTRSADQPWPGQLPPPAPATVLPHPLPAQVLDVRGYAVGINERAVLSGVPTRFVRTNAAGRAIQPAEPILAWAGPWPVDERWWNPDAARQRARFQIVVTNGRAWLVYLENSRWWIEASYD